MSNDSLLHEKAREVIRAGKLPDRAPDHVWGGRGTGADCAICSASIRYEEVELEVEFEGGARGPSSYLVHLHCFSALERERQLLVRSRAEPSSNGGLPEPANSLQNSGRGSGAASGTGPA
jgi:hypothetical protein